MKILKARNLKENIEELLEKQDFPAITIYLNTHKRWRKNEKSKIVLKNQLSKITVKLESLGLKKTDIDELLLPINKLSKNANFWKNASSGTAFFLSKGTTMAVQLVNTVPSKSYVNDCFNIKYLTEDLFERKAYYILAISPKNNFLYIAENKLSTLLPESDLLPKNMDSAIETANDEKSGQYHSTSSVSNVNQGGILMHSPGANKDGESILIERYLRKVDKSLNGVLKEFDMPMVLVCTNTVYPLYKEINSYPNLLENYISGNPDNPRERRKLLQKAWPLVKKHQTEKKNALCNEYKENYKKSISNLTEIVKAAYHGSVDKLFVGTKNDFWGKYNMSIGTIRTDKKRRKDSQDLVNLAILFTVKNGGEVYKVAKKKLGNESEVGALLRY